MLIAAALCAILAVVLRRKSDRHWPEHAITEDDMNRSQEADWLSQLSCFLACVAVVLVVVALIMWLT